MPNPNRHKTFPSSHLDEGFPLPTPTFPPEITRIGADLTAGKAQTCKQLGEVLLSDYFMD